MVADFLARAVHVTTGVFGTVFLTGVVLVCVNVLFRGDR